MAVKADRKRYILFEVISNKEFTAEMMKRAVSDETVRFLGELGASEASLRLLPEFWHKNKGVLVTNAKSVSKVKLVLALIKQIAGHQVMVKSMKVFGTLKKIKSGF